MGDGKIHLEKGVS